MDRSRYDNQSDQWRKRRGAQRRRARLLASIPKRLVFVTIAAMAAYVAQFIVPHSEGAPDLNVSHWIGRSPEPIAGVASVIDGDTIEIHGQRIRFNGIDAPESAQQCDDAKGFRYQCGAKAAAALGRLSLGEGCRHARFSQPESVRGIKETRPFPCESAKVGGQPLDRGCVCDAGNRRAI